MTPHCPIHEGTTDNPNIKICSDCAEKLLAKIDQDLQKIIDEFNKECYKPK